MVLSGLCLALLVLSVVTGLSGASLLSAWVSLELNMLAFLALMIFSGQSENSVAVKYFIAQAVGSSLFFLGVLLMESSEASSLALVLALTLKLGAAPLHFWFIEVMGEIGWELLVAVSTVQKILPLYLMQAISSMAVALLIFLNLVVGVLGAVNQAHLKKLLGYSSVFSTAWLLSPASVFQLTLEFLVAYSIALIVLALVLKMEMVAGLSSVAGKTMAGESKLLLIFSLISMAGVPPMVGFYPKVTIIQELLLQSETLLVVLLVLSSVFFLMAYMRSMFLALPQEAEGSVGAVPKPVGSGGFFVIFLLLLFLPPLI